MKTGAEDFLTKPVATDVLLNAVERAIVRVERTMTGAKCSTPCDPGFDALTPTERKVFALVVRGTLNKRIAAELGSAERTIKWHRQHIMEKLQLDSLAEMVSHWPSDSAWTSGEQADSVPAVLPFARPQLDFRSSALRHPRLGFRAKPLRDARPLVRGRTKGQYRPVATPYRAAMHRQDRRFFRVRTRRMMLCLQRRVAIVEDDAAMRVRRAPVAGEGYDTAHSRRRRNLSRAGSSTAQSGLSDIHLAGMSGIELRRRLAAASRHSCRDHGTLIGPPNAKRLRSAASTICGSRSRRVA